MGMPNSLMLRQKSGFYKEVKPVHSALWQTPHSLAPLQNQYIWQPRAIENYIYNYLVLQLRRQIELIIAK